MKKKIILFINYAYQNTSGFQLYSTYPENNMKNAGILVELQPNYIQNNKKEIER